MIDWRQYLTSIPDVCHGQLCAKDAAVAYAAELAREESLLPLVGP